VRDFNVFKNVSPISPHKPGYVYTSIFKYSIVRLLYQLTFSLSTLSLNLHV